jgi:hypothetical protein
MEEEYSLESLQTILYQSYNIIYNDENKKRTKNNFSFLNINKNDDNIYSKSL